MSLSESTNRGEKNESLIQPQDKVYGFDPLDWQDEFIHCYEREVLGDGAFGAGKTRAVCEKMGLNLIAYPGNRGLLTRKTHTSLVDTTLREFLDNVIPESWVVDHNQSNNLIKIQSPLYPATYCRACGFETNQRIDVRDNNCPECRSYTLANVPVSECYYKGLNTGSPNTVMPSNVRGMNLGCIGVDEAIECDEEDWVLLQSRLRLKDLQNPYVPELPLRQIFAATNPAGKTHWMYKRFYKQGIGETITAKTEDNIHNPDDYIESLTEQYTGVLKERYIEGEWVGFEGRVYKEWDESTHIISPLDVPDILGEGWTVANDDQLRERREKLSDPVGNPNDSSYQPARIIPPEDTTILMGIDWGYRPDPTVVQWWADTPTHGLVLYRELVRTRKLPDEMAKEALDRMAPHEVRNVRRPFADHESGERADWLEGAREWTREKRQERREVNPDDLDADRESIPDGSRLQTRPAEKAQMDGIRSVKRKLTLDENNRAGLYMIAGARAHQKDRHLARSETPGDIISEFRGYSWEDEDSEEPQDGEDHSMDTMRYVVHSMREASGGYETVVHKS